MSFGADLSTFSEQNQHFLYTLLAHAPSVLFGESAWALRLPAVFFGIGSIWALYALGVKWRAAGSAARGRSAHILLPSHLV